METDQYNIDILSKLNENTPKIAGGEIFNRDFSFENFTTFGNEYEIGRVIDAVTTCVKQGPFSTGSGS